MQTAEAAISKSQIAKEKKINLFLDAISGLDKQWLSKSEIAEKVGVNLDWFKSNPEMDALYHDAINGPRLATLREFLDRQTHRLNNSEIAQRTGLGLRWLSECREAVGLIEQYRSSARGL